MSNSQKFDNFFDVLKVVQTQRLEDEKPVFKKAVLVSKPKPKGKKFTLPKHHLPGYFMQKNSLSAKKSIELSETIKTSNRRKS